MIVQNLLVVSYRVTESGKYHILLHPPFQGKPVSVCGALHEGEHYSDRDHHLLTCSLCKKAIKICSDYIELKKNSPLYISPTGEKFAQMGMEEKEAVLTYRHQIDAFKTQWLAFCANHEIPIYADSPYDIDVVIFRG